MRPQQQRSVGVVEQHVGIALIRVSSLSSLGSMVALDKCDSGLVRKSGVAPHLLHSCDVDEERGRGRGRGGGRRGRRCLFVEVIEVVDQVSQNQGCICVCRGKGSNGADYWRSSGTWLS